MRISDWSSDVCSSDLFLQALVDAGPDLSARFLSVSRNNAALQVSDQLQVDDPVARCECVHTGNAREGAVQGKRAVGHDGCNLTNAAEESAGSRRVDLVIAVVEVFCRRSPGRLGRLTPIRPEARREGKECVSMGRSRWGA